ncbi:hypothetical protein LX16_1371 [Stackebrandtia albiflava]|uniref:Uncharacterized protein n=1 Tax=Stackebrandtia albiflava TaxID=406432 RepID=A0A562VCR2_9ACTN|nr:hypothetical protein [Stackebrandtia albiflava]TWJ15660.1 hypothetical protein LX16_1371 [Stackebrandtia albiflava]
MTRLNQLIAVEKTVKGKAQQKIAEVGRDLAKAGLLSGISRTYQPKDEDGEQLPPESTRVQVRADVVLKEVADGLTRLFDVTASKDLTNCTARADVVVDGQPLLRDVPVTTLLFLEKQLAEMQAFLRRLPVLDAAEVWGYNDAADCWSTEPVRTIRTRKVPRNHVKAEATEHHPAQVEVYHEDVPVGYWTSVKFSGAMQAKRLGDLLDRVDTLQHAVKFAREEANATEVVDSRIGDKVFGYLFR